ncbi:double zinc ribbon domain-containing protein [Paraburkholderia caribensis]|uniref:double zinc ribbon domain-containing protein n=1 Tax=Paraburkholderia caribensis TaxID=75105 RepID=UPI0009ECC509
MGFWERMLGGHHGNQGRGHGSGHGHGSSHGHGYGGPVDQAWGRGPAPMTSANGVACPQCKAVNARGSRFCGQCATSLVPVSCTQCSSAIPAGAKFCSQCGNTVG